MPPKVFVSHSSQDRERVEKLILPAFHAQGIQTWYSRDNVPITGIWLEGILSALRDSDWFIVVLTPSSIHSKWVKDEVFYALEKSEERVIPVLLDECDPSECHIRLKRIQYVDLRGETTKALEEVIERILDRKSGPTPPHPSAQPGKDRGVLERLKQSKKAETPEELVLVFRCIMVPDREVSRLALQALHAIGWDACGALSERIAREGDGERLGPILEGLAALESSPETLALLVRLTNAASGNLRNRAILLAERKRAGIALEKLRGYFRDHHSPYVINKALGNGLFAASYLGCRGDSGLEVVIRVLRPELALQDEVRARFIDLHRRSIHYVHEDLAMTRDAGAIPQDNLYYCIRDYIPGTTLQSALDSGLTFSSPQVLRLLQKTASALTPIHRRSEVHLGIKPTNIYVTGDHEVKLGDPSLPVSEVPPKTQRLAYDYRYAPPESFRDVPAFTPAADFYSLGCVAYQLLCGDPPFVSDKPFDLARLHLTGTILPPSQKGSRLGPEGDRCVMGLLERQPEKRRPESLARLIESIENLFRGIRSSGKDTISNVTVLGPKARERVHMDYSVIAIPPSVEAAESAGGAEEHIGSELKSKPDEDPSQSPSVMTIPASEAPNRPGERAEEIYREYLRRVENRDSVDLEELCRQHPNVADGLRSLYSLHSQSTYLARDDARDSTAFSSAGPSLLGDRIGPYVIHSVLGRGGMGEVYLAEQMEPLRRRVAIKILRSGLNYQERFEREKQAMAVMSHPGIATVFDAGVTEDGRPYLVMEHVAGLPINSHCDQLRLTVRERIELFLQVCEAVGHAHSNGIIHRDLKPSNILVKQEGAKAVPKVIDFGLGKSIRRGLEDKEHLTITGMVMGTPSFMSPEQADGRELDVDVRTDIYSLGVVLYELLSGGLFLESSELRGDDIVSMVKAIREIDPPPPSSRVLGSTRDVEIALKRRASPRGLFRQLRGDLDLIVMKCLAKVRERRYSSVADLAADLSRFLDFRPITARYPSIAYRLRVLIRRHPVASAAILLLISVLNIVALYFYWLLFHS